tara:strand:+ start:3823 stop:5175 length:1353 start_codon:yes stop_codon:yes gene_type:complete
VLKKSGNKLTFLFSFIMIAIFPAVSVHAACSPGIPCTDYDIYNDLTSGTDAAINGPKTGTAPPHANTTGTTTSACDGNFMNQIYSQAFMNASREVIMSEQIIHKPDSVLEYTCFDQWVSVAAEHAGPIFSESTTWEDHEVCLSTGDDTASSGRPPTCPDGSGENVVSPQSVTINVVFPDDHLDNVLEPLLFPTLQTYIDNNFSHTYLGEATTIDNDLDTSDIGSGSYNCSHMSTVWNIAKCIDFEEDDRFRTFEDLVNADPRSIPVECSAGFSASDAVEAGTNSTKLDSTTPGSSTSSTSIMNPCPASAAVVSGVNTDFSNDLIRIANNCDDGANLNAYSIFDTMKLYDEMILGLQTPIGTYIPGTGGSTSGVITDCSDPIPTGVPVVTYEYINAIGAGVGLVNIVQRTPRLHYEYICTNPGCYYRPVKVPYVTNGPVPASTPAGACLPY